MNLDLLTIAKRGELSGQITKSYNSTIERLKTYETLLQKITSSKEFSDYEKEQNRIFTIIGSVSIFEHYLNSVLLSILVSYPKKFGDKIFKIEELSEEGSLFALFEKKASQVVLDHAYGRFEKYIEKFKSYAEIKEPIDHEAVLVVNEIKTTRDVYIHNNGVANSIYFQKAGNKARVTIEGEILPINEKYLKESIDSLISFLSILHNNMPEYYKNSTNRKIFREMWEKTCLKHALPFEKAWEVKNEEVFFIRDKNDNYGLSSSEALIYDFFKDIYLGKNNTDFGYLMKRWEPKSNESQIVYSWINSPFWL